MQQYIEGTKNKKTYPQNWAAYNAAQTNEKDQFLKFLHELCKTVIDPNPQTRGRPRIPLNEAVFAICYKIYSTYSGRRFMSDLRAAATKGYLAKAPHFNSLYNYLENPKLTPILVDLIIQTSLPLSAIETNFAVDSTGFTALQSKNWREHKYGTHRSNEWVKVHISCGVKTNIVTAVEIWGRYSNDVNHLPDLVDTTAANFQIKEVLADKAYPSLYNYNLIEKHGATPFIPFRSNHQPGAVPTLWSRMYHYFKYRQEEFNEHYHKRSNVETTFAMVKAKFGGYVRSKTEIAMKNECLCKIICHNLCVLGHEMRELGIEVDFSAQKGGLN